MTEEEWQSPNPNHLLQDIAASITLRKALLLGAAACHRLAQWNCFPQAKAAIDIAEARADGLVNDEDWQIAYQSVYDAREAAGRMVLSDPDSEEPNDGNAMYFAVEAAVALLDSSQGSLHVASMTLWACRRAIRCGDHSPERQATHSECKHQCDLVRDIFGNLFCSGTFSPECRTDTAVSLARQMYEARDFSLMPILADALQDAGCDIDDILNHCRDTNQVHVRGCWVVDLVLGKE
ncbi:MAG: hypothetical protein L0241_20590 [Planctomycetia bacterium]|nr:hypothetical protein [Planctomycetia bacterium]